MYLKIKKECKFAKNSLGNYPYPIKYIISHLPLINVLQFY